jgi:hypothetical protein
VAEELPGVIILAKHKIFDHIMLAVEVSELWSEHVRGPRENGTKRLEIGIFAFLIIILEFTIDRVPSYHRLDI